MIDDEFMTSGEAGKYLGVHRSTFGKWVKQGFIEPSATVGQRVRFARGHLDGFVRQNPDMIARSKRSAGRRSGRVTGGEG